MVFLAPPLTVVVMGGAVDVFMITVPSSSSSGIKELLKLRKCSNSSVLALPEDRD